MLIRDFSGGKNIRVNPSLLAENEAQIYTNIDNATGSLTSIQGPVSTGIPIDKYFTYFEADDEWVSRPTEATFVEYRDTLYISDGTILQSYKDLTLSKLGILPPTTAPTVSLVETISANVDITIEDGGDIIKGFYNYKLVVFSSILSTSFELDYSCDVALTFTGKKITFTLTGLPIATFTDGDLIKLYREDGVNYYEVGETTYSIAGGATIIDTKSTETLGDLYISDREIFTYCYTYYNSANGIESPPSPISEEVNSAGNDVIIAPLPKSTETDVTIDKIRLYKIGGGLTAYTLVHEFDHPAVATPEYKDGTGVLSLAGSSILDSLNHDRPVEGLKYLTEAYAMLFAAVGDKLYFTEIAKPYSWPAEFFIDFDGDITGIGAMSNGLLVFTKFKTYIVVGNSPASFSKFLLSSSQGCISHQSVAFVDNQLLWMSLDGLCTTSGGIIQVVSRPKVGKLTFNTIYSAAVHDSIYYLSYYHPLGNKIMAFDFRYNQIVRDIEVIGEQVVTALDNVYQYYNGTLQRLFDGDLLQMHWKSPVFTEGSYSNYKNYKDIYIRYNGTFNIKVFIDGILANEIDVTGDKMYNLKLGNGVTKGYGIEFEIEGTGTVYEIQYKVEPRQKG